MHQIRESLFEFFVALIFRTKSNTTKKLNNLSTAKIITTRKLILLMSVLSFEGQNLGQKQKEIIEKQKL